MISRQEYIKHNSENAEVEIIPKVSDHTVTVQRTESKGLDSTPHLFSKEVVTIKTDKGCPTFMDIPADPNHEDCSQKTNINVRIEELEKDVSRAKEEASSLRRVIENRNLELQATRAVFSVDEASQAAERRVRKKRTRS